MAAKYVHKVSVTCDRPLSGVGGLYFPVKEFGIIQCIDAIDTVSVRVYEMWTDHSLTDGVEIGLN